MLIYYIELTQKLAPLASGIERRAGAFGDGKELFENATKRGGNSRSEIILLKILLFLPRQ